MLDNIYECVKCGDIEPYSKLSAGLCPGCREDEFDEAEDDFEKDDYKMLKDEMFDDGIRD